MTRSRTPAGRPIDLESSDELSGSERSELPDEASDSESTDGPSESHLPDVPAVRRALRALADGTAPDGTAPAAYRRIVDEAAASIECVEDAASLLADDPDRLRRAVSAARERGDESTAARGRRVLADLARYRRAAAGEPLDEAGDHLEEVSDRSAVDAPSDEVGNGIAATAENCDDGAIGRGTVLPGDGQSPDR